MISIHFFSSFELCAKLQSNGTQIDKYRPERDYFTTPTEAALAGIIIRQDLVKAKAEMSNARMGFSGFSDPSDKCPHR